MKRWIQPTLVLSLTVVGTSVLLFPRLFVWPPKGPNLSAVLGRLRSTAPRTIAKPAQQRPAARQLKHISAHPEQPARRAVHAINVRPKALHHYDLALLAAARTRRLAPKVEVHKATKALQAEEALVSPTSPSLRQAQSSGIENQKPLGFVEQMDGKVEAFITGADGVQVVREGQVVGGQRVVKITPDSVELAAVEPQRQFPAPTDAFAVAKPAGAHAEQTPTTKARASRYTPSKSVGNVELANGERQRIVFSGRGIRLKPYPSNASAPITSNRQLALRRSAPRAGPINLRHLPRTQVRRLESSLAVTSKPEIQNGHDQIEAANKSSSLGKYEATDPKPIESVTALPPAQQVGYVEKAGGQVLNIVARADGIRLIPGTLAEVNSASIALNSVGRLPGREPDFSTEPLDRAPPEALYADNQKGIEPEISDNIAADPKANEHGREGEVRPWFRGLPGLGGNDRATYIKDWFDSPKLKGEPLLVPPVAVKSVSFLPPPPAAIHSHPALGQSVGYVAWADGRKSEIFTTLEGVKIVDEPGANYPKPVLSPETHNLETLNLTKVPEFERPVLPRLCPILALPQTASPSAPKDQAASILKLFLKDRQLFLHKKTLHHSFQLSASLADIGRATLSGESSFGLPAPASPVLPESHRIQPVSYSTVTSGGSSSQTLAGDSFIPATSGVAHSLNLFLNQQTAPKLPGMIQIQTQLHLP